MGQIDLTPERAKALYKKNYPRTDKGNAERVCFLFGKLFLHVGDNWIVWDEEAGHWDKTDGVRHLRAYVWKALSFIMSEALESTNEKEQEALMAWAYKSQSAHALKGCLTALTFMPGLSATMADFDGPECLWALPVKNGILNLRDNSFGPHRPELRYTMASPVVYDPEAICPEYDRFLRSAQPDPEMQGFLLRLAGSRLTGIVRDHKVAINISSGRSGKGTQRRTEEAVLGPYAGSISRELLFRRNRNGHPTEWMGFKNKRLISVSETKRDAEFSEADVNMVTGGDVIRGALKYKDEEEFAPTHKMSIDTNALPIIKDATEGIWERVMLITWPRNFAKEGTMDETLGEKLALERSGILNRFLEGLADWRENGLQVPSSVRMETKEYRQDQDVLGQFLAARCIVDGSAKEKATPLYEAWCAWWKEQGNQGEPENQMQLAARLKLKGFTKKVSGTVTWHGLRLRGAQEKLGDKAALNRFAEFLTLSRPFPITEVYRHYCDKWCTEQKVTPCSMSELETELRDGEFNEYFAFCTSSDGEITVACVEVDEEPLEEPPSGRNADGYFPEEVANLDI